MTAARRRARRAEAPSVTGGRRKTPRGREQSVSRPSQRPPSDAAAPRDPRTRRLAGRRLRPGPCGRGSGDACCHAPSGRSSSPSRRGGVPARPAVQPRWLRPRQMRSLTLTARAMDGDFWPGDPRSTMTVLPTGPTSISSGKRSGKGARAVALTARLTRRSRSVYICWRWQGSGDRSASCSATRRRPRDRRARQTPRRCAAPPRPIPDLAPGRMPRGTRDMREPAPPSRPSRPRRSGDRHPQLRSGPLATASQRRTVRVTPRPFLPHSRSPGPSPGRPPGRRATTAPQRRMLCHRSAPERSRRRHRAPRRRAVHGSVLTASPFLLI